MRSARQLVLVLGDQLDPDAEVLRRADRAQDLVWMAEVAVESTHVWSSQPRIAMFLAAMRHYRREAEERGWAVRYTCLDDEKNTGDLAGELRRAVGELRPQRLLVTEPGEWRVRELLQTTASALGVELEVVPDRHFFCTQAEFARHAQGRKQLRLEFFYREMRRRHGVLMDAAGEPEGGAWNFDAENRGSFGREGPPPHAAPRRFQPDALTREVIALVQSKFAGHPGSLDDFDWPVTVNEAEAALEDFITNRLPDFGRWQDAMWTAEPWLFHSRISAALNLKLLDPRRAVAAAETAWREGRVPLPSAEGFIRQVLGWREYVRGIYWHFMPAYLDRNALGACQPLPRFYWTGDCAMNCLREVLGQTLRLGYANHIQRLMVTGLYAQLLGVMPREVHAWFLAVHVDAVEWVELPNTLGMSQYADGGVMASKPYVATGNYIRRMSNYCSGCRFDPGQSTGDRACPFTTLYWDFLLRHETLLRANQRMALQVRNLARLTPAQRREISLRAEALRAADGQPTEA